MGNHETSFLVHLSCISKKSKPSHPILNTRGAPMLFRAKALCGQQAGVGKHIAARSITYYHPRRVDQRRFLASVGRGHPHSYPGGGQAVDVQLVLNAPAGTGSLLGNTLAATSSAPKCYMGQDTDCLSYLYLARLRSDHHHSRLYILNYVGSCH